MTEVNSVSITKEFEPWIQNKIHSEYFVTLLSVLLYQYPALIHSHVTGTIYSNQFTESLNNPLMKRQDAKLRMVKIQDSSVIIIKVLKAERPRNFISIYGMV